MSNFVGNVLRGFEAFFLNDINGNVIYICSDSQSLDAIASNIKFLDSQKKVIIFPEWDCLPYDRVSPKSNVLKQRMTGLAELLTLTESKVVITSAAAIMQALPPVELIRNLCIRVNVGDAIGYENFLNHLQKIGFERYSVANEQGEYAARGSIIDLVLDESGTGIRLDFFGDVIDSIRTFNIETQLSHDNKIDKFLLFPVTEVIFTDSTISSFQKQYLSKFGLQNDPLLESVSAKRKYMGMEHWLPLFYEKTSTIFDYLSYDATVVIDDIYGFEMFKSHFDSVYDYFKARQEYRGNKISIYNPLDIEELYLTYSSIKELIEKLPYFVISQYRSESNNISVYPSPSFYLSAKTKNITPYELIREFLETNIIGSEKYSVSKLVFGCFTEGSRDRLAALLKDNGFNAQILSSWMEINTLSKNSIAVIVFAIERGFIYKDVMLASEQDLLGERQNRIQKRKKKGIRSIEEINGLNVGDYVVHIDHGIGMFAGIESIKVDEVMHDFIKIIYLGEDKFYLPVENFELISRYSSNDSIVVLDKLGSLGWQKRKATVKNRIRLAAETLLSVAAERKMKVAPILEPIEEFYEIFCSKFPYIETEDQSSAIEDVLNDIKQNIPADRLICGDVGFGKTEVVMRAAAASVGGLNHAQVAVIVPTTLLSRQHYKNFCERFSDLPVTIGQLSKFSTATQMKNIKCGLEKGDIDIVIGTHALLAKDVKFKNLGLIIIDEEQHFGVSQKEKLKQLKSNAHILTLSATPIPRTMQMSLCGIKDLSLISTPPIDRLPVHTVVMPFDPMVLRDAIMREHNRNGRVFYITPRIQYIDELHKQITKIVPEIKIGIAHGKMTANELDKIMNDFYDGVFDLLISTTIIESGLDITTANTIIIDRAEMFGLAQLYQIRGRVGRSKVRAYAYLITKEKVLSESAKKRLDVLQSLDYSGAGIAVATHDMDIRGYGNLVGEEQSGHIKEVGVELYQSMLNDAVESLSSNSFVAEDAWSPTLNIGIPVQLPNDYIGDISLKLSVYKKLTSLNTEDDIELYALELIDRFGSLPLEAQGLIDVVKLKVIAKSKCVSKIDCGDKAVVISFHNGKPASYENLMSFISKCHDAKLRPDGRLLIMRTWKSNSDRLIGLKKILCEL